MPALLFGSISTLADTSEEQRAAFNEAFVEHGLGWSWERDEYRDLLTGNGGQQRIADYAAERGENVDAAAVHASKSEIFQRKLAALPTAARPGVKDVIAQAREQGWQIGLVTTTSSENVTGVLTALQNKVNRDDFDLIVDNTVVDESKPSPAAYQYALEKLGIEAAEAVAVEDNVGGTRSAADAGIACIAFPNENTMQHDFGSTPVSHHLEFDALAASVAAR